MSFACILLHHLTCGFETLDAATSQSCSRCYFVHFERGIFNEGLKTVQRETRARNVAALRKIEAKKLNEMKLVREKEILD